MSFPSGFLRPVLALSQIAALLTVTFAAGSAGAAEQDFDPVVIDSYEAEVGRGQLGSFAGLLAEEPPAFDAQWQAGERFGGIARYADEFDDRFVVAVEDRLEVFDEAGERIAVIEGIPGTQDPVVSDDEIIVGSSTGEIHRIDLSSLTIQESIDTGVSSILALTALDDDIYYLTVDRPDLIGRVNLLHDSVSLAHIETPGPNRFLGTRSVYLVAVSDRLRMYWPRTANPGQEMENAGPLDDARDITFSPYRHNGWLAQATGVPQFNLSEDELVDYPDLMGAATVAVTQFNTMLAVGTVGSEQWDVRVHDGPSRPLMVLALDDEDAVADRGIELGNTAVAAVVNDASCGCLALVVEELNPRVDDAEVTRTVEVGEAASLTLTGGALDTVRITDPTKGWLDAVANGQGTELVIDLSEHEVGRYTLLVSNRTGVIELTVDVVAPAPPPVDITATPCPWITDSVARLYSAYFLRNPDVGGFEFWLTEYSSGNWSLARMSQFFSDSPEFVDLYGSLDDRAFVDLVYRNVLGRSPDAAGLAYWVGRMNSEGLTRGELMLNFSESPEYVGLTGTARSLAGDFNSFPAGTTWACGFNAVTVPVPDTAFVDVVFFSLSNRDQQISVDELHDGAWHQVAAEQLPPQTLLAYWSIPYADSATTSLRLTSTGDFGWMVVLSPAQTPSVRAGWG